jgi:hypothetical protein
MMMEYLVEWRLAGETEVLGESCPSATLSTTNPTWPDPGRRGGKPAANRLSYGAAYCSLSDVMSFNVLMIMSMFSACVVDAGVVLVPCLASSSLEEKYRRDSSIHNSPWDKTFRFDSLAITTTQIADVHFSSDEVRFCTCPCSSFLFTPQFFCLSRFCFTVAFNIRVVPTSTRTRPELLLHGVCQV